MRQFVKLLLTAANTALHPAAALAAAGCSANVSRKTTGPENLAWLRVSYTS